MKGEYIDMAKVNNIVRFYDFKSESDLFSQIDTDLDTVYRDNHIYKLQTVQIIEPNKALVIMEEDTDRVIVYFYYRYLDHDEKWQKEEIILDDLSSDYIIMSVSELQMLRNMGKITLNSLDYDIHDMQYIIESDGEKIMEITLK